MKLLELDRVFSFLLALALVFSTLSFTMEKHFCGGTLVDVAVFTKVKGCGMDASSEGMLILKECCKNEIELVKGLDNIKLNTLDDIVYEQILGLNTFAYGCISNLESVPKKKTKHKNYSSPNLIYDRQILDQVFII